MNENALMESVIRAEGLGKTYAEGKMHTPVFDGLDLNVAAGETVAIVGASGAGKSTLLHLLGGLDVPTAGEVYVAGQRMSGSPGCAPPWKSKPRIMRFAWPPRWLKSVNSLRPRANAMNSSYAKPSGPSRTGWTMGVTRWPSS